MNSTVTPSSRQQIRQHIRTLRRGLNTQQQDSAAQGLLSQCQQSAWFSHAQHIALYLSNDGEVSTQPIIEWLWQQGKQVYLPVLHPFSRGHLLFLRYCSDTPMVNNRYGINEPRLDVRLVKPASELDLICTPLVAFDNTGQRLGMGGGYYDRTLAPWHQARLLPRPLGLAHDCQQVSALPHEAWDVPLPTILTPSQTFNWE